MLVAKLGRYNYFDIRVLHSVLKTGLKETIPLCSGNCDKCGYKEPCRDVSSVIHYLESKLDI